MLRSAPARSVYSATARRKVNIVYSEMRSARAKNFHFRICTRPIIFKMTTLPYKKRLMAGFLAGEQLEPLDLSTGSTTSPSPPATSTSSPSTGLYKCNECPSGFVAYERLRAHQRRHTIKKNGRYTCQQCKKTFVQQSSLITHTRIHSGERPYRCKVCNRTYGDLSTYTKHKRTHSGEKPYECNFCGRKFSQSGNCLRHKRSVHKQI